MHKFLSTGRIYRLDKKLQENGCLLGKRQKGSYGNVAWSPKSIAHKVVVCRSLYFTVYKPQLVYALNPKEHLGRHDFAVSFINKNVLHFIVPYFGSGPSCQYPAIPFPIGVRFIMKLLN